MEKNKCNKCETDNPITNKYCSRCGYELPKIQTVIEEELINQETTKKMLCYTFYKDKKEKAIS
jgi:predicted amidophosphoribosyltransferase